MSWTADLETTTDENDCHPWVYGLCNIDNPDEFYYNDDTNLDRLFEFMENSKNSTFYFHNLKFDGEFVFTWLFEHDFKHVTDRKDLDSKTFTTLISDRGQFYSIKVVFEKKGKKVNAVTIYDSMKILPFKVKEIAKGFNLPFRKGEIPYDAHNGEKKPITPEEVDYLKRDVQIPAMALKVLFSQGLDAMTQGSNALADYKAIVTPKKFEKWFPVPDYDYDVRQSYKGGFTYLSDAYKAIDVEKGIVLDVNSLYPWVMYECPLPYGHGIFFEGQYQEDKLYNLYVQMLTCQFEVKENYIPTIQLKNNLAFMPTEYLKSSGENEVTLCLTSVDLELFFTHYEVYNITYHSGWKFKSTVGLFKNYIDKWMQVKIESTLNGNKAMRTLAKLMLNALYGKFATNPRVRSKIPYFEDGQVKYCLGEEGTKKPIYIPIGTFITSWARYKTITSAQQIRNNFVSGKSNIDFIYADTDSLHCISPDGTLPEGLDIDDVKLGAWKHETTFNRARFLRQKTYIETVDITDKEYEDLEEQWQKDKCYTFKDRRVHDKITCAGMPEACYKLVTWDNFRVLARYEGKLQPKHVKGGIVLKNVDFSIKR